jgi:hypothetical protein
MPYFARKLIPKLGFVLLISINVALSQDSTGSLSPGSFHAVGITIGVNQVKEENLLPRVHSGFITTLAYDYICISERYQDFKFALGISRIIANPEDVTKSANLMLTSSYSYCFKLIEVPNISYFIGPQAKLAYSVFFYPNWDESHLYWGNLFSIGVSNFGTYKICSRTRLVSTLTIALFSLYSRPNALRLYKIDELSFGSIFKSLHQNLEFGFITAVTTLHFDIEYQFPVFETKTEAFFYSFDYAHIGKGNALPFTQLFHQLGLRILL